MSTTALFYPHTTLAGPRKAGVTQDYDRLDTNLLKTALLLWDDVEVIVPYHGFEPRVVIHDDQKGEEASIREAFEMVVRPRVISYDGIQSEMRQIHTELKQLFAGGIPETLKFAPSVDNYEFYPGKLSQEIWDLLKEHKLVVDYGVRRDMGLIIMGVIADVCAGGTRKTVTNYKDAHEARCRLIAAQNDGNVEFEPDTARAYQRLASISVKTANAGAFPLARLVRARRRETEDGLLPILRKNYRIELDKYLDRMTTEVKTLADIDLIEREFEKGVQEDFSELQEMLELESMIPILSGGVAVFALLLGGPVTAATAIAVGLPTFLLARRKTFKQHYTAWLYKA